MEPGLTELEQIWSLLLLSCSLLLNLVALVVLVRWAGSCHSDPAVPPLISVTGQPHLTPHTSHPHILTSLHPHILTSDLIWCPAGCSLLHSVMVEIFSVQQQSLQQFNFSPRLCQVIIINHLVLMDVPFITIALLLAITLRRLSKVSEDICLPLPRQKLVQKPKTNTALPGGHQPSVQPLLGVLRPDPPDQPALAHSHPHQHHHQHSVSGNHQIWWVINI